MTALRLLIGSLGLAVSLWLAGFMVFVGRVQVWDHTRIPSPNETTDALVVLTGGRERVDTGLELLKAGAGHHLLISGVHPGVTLDGVFDHTGITKNMRDCCVTLGHMAESTLGNAEETAAWMAQNHYHSLRLVTANYHMPRSLMIFRRAMPDMTILPHPVAPDSVMLADWWDHPGTVNVLVNEYNKYIWAWTFLELSNL